MQLICKNSVAPAAVRRERGLSMVELLVGVAIGLFLIGGAISLFVSNLQGSRRLLVDARINQDLRTAADLIARDLRRAGYWANAISGTIAIGTGSTTVPNVYSTITANSATSTITYNFARDADNTLQNNEYFGFKLEGGVIKMLVDNTPTWQAVTDPNVMTVTAFTITVPTNPDGTPRLPPVAMGGLCTSGCNTSPPPTVATAGCPNPPLLYVRRYDLVIRATAAGDTSIKRELRESIRVRNDRITGSCPA